MIPTEIESISCYLRLALDGPTDSNGIVAPDARYKGLLAHLCFQELDLAMAIGSPSNDAMKILGNIYEDKPRLIM